MVHEDKLIWFLKEEVLTRKLRTSAYARARKTMKEEDVKQTLSVTTVNGYVSALISLYNFQRESGSNKHAHPRGAKLKAVLKNRGTQEAVERKEEFVDRGANTMLDNYRQQQMIDIV